MKLLFPTLFSPTATMLSLVSMSSSAKLAKLMILARYATWPPTAPSRQSYTVRAAIARAAHEGPQGHHTNAGTKGKAFPCGRAQVVSDDPFCGARPRNAPGRFSPVREGLARSRRRSARQEGEADGRRRDGFEGCERGSRPARYGDPPWQREPERRQRRSRPCRVRPASSQARLGAAAHSTDASVNRARPPRNSARRPKWSPAPPPSRLCATGDMGYGFIRRHG